MRNAKTIFMCALTLLLFSWATTDAQRRSSPTQDQASPQLSMEVSDQNNAAAFVSDVTIADGTAMSPGQRFTKTWRLRNSGTSTWRDTSLVFVGGAQMGAPDSVSVPTTAPGETVDISVPMTAPTEAGAHRGNWQMRTADGTLFGQNSFVQILVKAERYEGRTFEEWSADLKAHSPAVREKAVNALPLFGPRATSPLITTFRDDADEQIRVLALGALAGIVPLTKETLRVFLGAATDPSPLVSNVALMFNSQALPSMIGPDMVPVLIEALRDANATRRQVAIQLLAPLGPAAKEAAPTLRELADHDPEPRVRNIATEALKLIETR